MAASATLALKAGVWFRRGLLLIVSPIRGYHRRYQAETPLIDLFKFASPALRCGSGFSIAVRDFNGIMGTRHFCGFSDAFFGCRSTHWRVFIMRFDRVGRDRLFDDGFW